MKISFAGNRLFCNDGELTYWSSGTTERAHFYPIIMAVASPNERYVLSLDKEGILKVWDGNNKMWDSRASHEYRIADVRAIAIPDSARAIFVATEHEVLCLQMMRPSFSGDYGSVRVVCTFPIALSIAKLQCAAEGLLATDASGQTELIRVKI